MSAFIEFQKIGRLKRGMVITEKIDGTNAQVHIVSADTPTVGIEEAHVLARNDAGDIMLAGSRSKYLSVGRDGAKGGDNFGFAGWVQAHAAELWALGPGRHYGEWWGSGIQRGYGLPSGEKRFSLFNTSRWGRHSEPPACCHVVPVLKQWTFDTTVIDSVITELARTGSQAAPVFMKPEGIVIFHSATGTLFKRTIEKDDEWKGKATGDVS